MIRPPATSQLGLLEVACPQQLPGTSVDAKSVLPVMGRGATSGKQVIVRATGSDAAQAVAAIVGILAQATPVGG